MYSMAKFHKAPIPMNKEGIDCLLNIIQPTLHDNWLGGQIFHTSCPFCPCKGVAHYMPFLPL